ncbi:DUF3341 domain-containing protein [soil metagenome]
MSAATTTPEAPWGVLAEFETADALVDATRKAREAGYSRMDGYSPYPIGEVADELGFPRSEIGAIMFIGGMFGAISGFLMMSWACGFDYRIIIAGKPFVSWPMFIPITWELLVLTASLTGVIGLFALCGLPMPYHPLFNVPQFANATKDRFFLAIEAVDPKYDLANVKTFMHGLQALSVEEVPA